ADSTPCPVVMRARALKDQAQDRERDERPHGDGKADGRQQAEHTVRPGRGRPLLVDLGWFHRVPAHPAPPALPVDASVWLTRVMAVRRKRATSARAAQGCKRRLVTTGTAAS